jgi:hypothetical protein
LHEVALRVTQEPETFARNFDDTFAEFRLGLNWFATFGTNLRSLASAGGRPIQGLNISDGTGRIGIN